MGGFLGVAALALLVQTTYLGLLLVELAASMPAGGDFLERVAGDLVLKALVVSMLLLLPLTALVGVHMTFRVAGPLYRFHQYMRSVAAGDDPGPCRLRDGDEFQELCDLINAGLERTRRDAHDQALRDGMHRNRAA
jgi:hypothetical protein